MSGIFLGEEITSRPADETDRAMAAIGTIAVTTLVGAGAALFTDPHKTTGIIVASAVTAAWAGSSASAPMFCGLFASKDEQTQIDEQLMPGRIGSAVACGAAAVLGGIVGGKMAKKHPKTGAVIGASFTAGAVAAAAVRDCPDTRGTT